MLFDTNITSLGQIIQYTPILICSSEFKKSYVRERYDYITKNLNKIDYQIYVIKDNNPANLFLVNVFYKLLTDLLLFRSSVAEEVLFSLI